ncbi:MAG: ARMT1-like domain-containing protein [Candidatus Omnitrophota bacterium]
MKAVELAIAGNVIDYAAKNNLNVEKEIQEILAGSFSPEQKRVFEYELFRKELAEAKTILYLADNAGEIVFDRVLIEEICAVREVTVAVRYKPILNDAVMEDAVFCGIDKIAHVISSGVDSPGTVLDYCSDEFLKIFKRADMVISKGQGNYEALSEAHRKIYFLFKVKCPVIANHSGARMGDIVLKRI